jgi:L-ribulose-5-phosphate 3-epimerase UlaE
VHTTGSSKGKLDPEYLLMGVDDRGERIKHLDWTWKVIENEPKRIIKEIRKELEKRNIPMGSGCLS